LEHGGTDNSTEHYQTVAWWYGAPAAALLTTDELKIGDIASETAHGYVSPQASVPYAITSRYEWGVDTIGTQEIFPATTDYGRKTVGSSEFTLKIIPQNRGVMLRRKLDYQFPNQRAEVFVADGSATNNPNWQPAGVWYLAGGNTCVYSNPKGESGATQHRIETSNRRFRDDEFLLPLDLTRNRSSIRIRIKFNPVATPLFPGAPPAELAWSEIRYNAYCFVMPQWDPHRIVRQTLTLPWQNPF
jgi:D-arabinan exo alpha-(1,3)/(1,5)-arabinofuranosidase (non-reducing end)